MKSFHLNFRALFPVCILLIALIWSPWVFAAAGKSDLNKDGTVDYEDLAIFSVRYLEQTVETVAWCEFYKATDGEEDLYGRTPAFYHRHFQDLLNFINRHFGCDLSDVNKDGLVDLNDLRIFSTMYLELNWEAVNWCEFYEATATEARFNGKSTDYYLRYFGTLLGVILDSYGCPVVNPSLLKLKNEPRGLLRMAVDALNGGNYYFSDPRVGSVFVYDSFLTRVGEIKNLNKPLGVAIDSLGYLLVGNNGRDNVEVYDPATGDLLAVLGAGLVEMPTAITIGPNGDIYITDSRAHRVWVFDSSYVHVRTLGSPGREEGELRFPTDAVILSRETPTGMVDEVYVADQGNKRIQVFNPQGDFIRTITPPTVLSDWCLQSGFWCPSDVRGAFTRLQALETDAAGRLHVLDSYETAVIILDPVSGSKLGFYGAYGQGPGLLRVPQDLLINGFGEAFVTDYRSGEVEVFAVP